MHRKTLVLESLFNKVAGLKACNMINKETPTYVFSCAYFEICKNIYFEKHLGTAASKTWSRKVLDFGKIAFSKNEINFYNTSANPQ